MNRELRALLATAGYARALEPDSWSSAIVMKNYGAVPSPPDLPSESPHRGFKLLLLDGTGRATHLAHVGASTDPLLENVQCQKAPNGTTTAMDATVSAVAPITITTRLQRRSP